MLNWNAIPRHAHDVPKELLSDPGICCICSAAWKPDQLPYREFFVIDYKLPQDVGACPRCHASGRHRLLHYAKEHGLLDFKNQNILFLSPEAHYEKFLLKHFRTNNTVVSSNLNLLHHHDVSYDITNIDCADGVYDAVICIHILEHIEDDKAALEELHRVLKSNGTLVISVPQSNRATTFSDPSVESRESRMLHYLWEDHVRLYGRDFRSKYLHKYAEIATLDIETDPTWMQQQRILESDVIHFCKKL